MTDDAFHFPKVWPETWCSETAPCAVATGLRAQPTACKYCCPDTIEALTAQRDEAVAALRKYGQHDDDCNKNRAARWGAGEPGCICGFTAALVKLEGGK